MAQRLSLGVVAGGSTTNGFQNVTELNPQGTNTIHAYSQKKDWLRIGNIKKALQMRAGLINGSIKEGKH